MVRIGGYRIEWWMAACGIACGLAALSLGLIIYSTTVAILGSIITAVLVTFAIAEAKAHRQ